MTKKTDENSYNGKSKNSYLLRDLMSFNQIPGKSATYDDIKSDKKNKVWHSSDSIFFETYS